MMGSRTFGLLLSDLMLNRAHSPTPQLRAPAIRAPQIHRSWLSAAAFAGMFGFGIVMAILGAVLPLLARRIHFDLSQAGELFLAMNAAMLVTAFVVGPSIDRSGHKPPLVIGPLFVAVALGLISAASHFGELVAALLILGIGGGSLNQVTNTLVADIHEDERGKSAALNILGVFFGFGALFIPLSIGSLLRHIGLPAILCFSIVLSLFPVVLSLSFAFPEPRQRKGVSFSEMAAFARRPLVLAFAFLLFFESGNEFIIGGYLTTYLTTKLGASVPAASYLLAAYWGALMLGRVILSRVTLRQSGAPLILTSALAVAGSVAFLLLSPSLPVAAAAVVLLGLSIAAIFPTVLGLAGSSYPNHSGTVFGILMGVALSGGMLLPWAVGKTANVWGIGSGLWIAAFDALAVFGFQLAATRLRVGTRHTAPL